MLRFLMLIFVGFIPVLPTVAANLYQYPESVVFDTLRNCYFVSDPSNGYIVQIDDQNCQSLFYSFGSPKV